MSTEVPSNKNSIGHRKPVYGVGINDADYMVHIRINGKHMICPYYGAWKSMLRRCHDPKFHENNPTYIGCSAAEEWLTFSNFREWMIEQDWEDKQLDKDIINPGNKVYSPENCCFVTHAVNSLLNDHARARGKWPKGVCFHKRDNKFRAQLSVNGKIKHLGSFDTPEEAESAYIQAKYDHILVVANEQINQRIRQGLIRQAESN